MGTEVELKLATSRSALRKAMALPWLRKMSGDTVKHQHLISVYFDTPKLTLRDHGVSLRVRRVGDRQLQTIKAVSGALVTRDEWEQNIEGDQPKLELAGKTALAPLLSGKIKDQLQPVFETDVDRITMLVRTGDSEIELAFDTGRINTADDHAEISEIEIELKHGERHGVAMLAKRLARSVPVTYEPSSKSERGYALVEGSLDAPVFARPISIQPSATAEEAFVAIGFECLRHFAANQTAVRHGDPEGIHQMRVGLRRLRAALSLFKQMLQGSDFRKLKGELVWLTEQLGPARDYDVLVSNTLVPLRSSHRDAQEFAALESELDHQREAALAAAKAAVESQRFRGLLLDTALRLFDGDWHNNPDALETSLRKQPIEGVAKQELTRRMRKIAKRARDLRTMDPRRRHKVRIAVKKLRYAREFFQSLMPDDHGRRASRKIDHALKDLQSALGCLNDMTVHSRLAHRMARINSATRKAYAIGYLTGQEDARSRRIYSKAIQTGKRLRHAI
ncbi:Inorganic triphosphatase YgiF, contains CYTH and CHAD domains [Bradyrhizobium lablabi]|uniref:Inorganic triphosphatase YgiF, contains CYTH and CHAD domains n=1 Tax=Bradyrhizobium lablabi TaxID=722472 RepID=A0A1M6VJR5_9BRAD|nr:CYTH and CHAD domain-containing protein [Bradyrhizobium lablabi]SHK81698.1 Inorganic triphosphatase YgiF, contains CYTH and CHAD domains [Bradyrhizobium lablabi]